MDLDKRESVAYLLLFKEVFFLARGLIYLSTEHCKRAVKKSN